MYPQDFPIRGSFPNSPKEDRKLFRSCIGMGGVIFIVGAFTIISREEIMSLVTLCYTPILALSLSFFDYALRRVGEYLEISDDSVSIKRKEKQIWTKTWEELDELRIERIVTDFSLIAIKNRKKRRLPVSDRLQLKLKKMIEQGGAINSEAAAS